MRRDRTVPRGISEIDTAPEKRQEGRLKGICSTEQRQNGRIKEE
jgi:hypothetical protein